MLLLSLATDPLVLATVAASQHKLMQFGYDFGEIYFSFSYQIQ